MAAPASVSGVPERCVDHTGWRVRPKPSSTRKPNERGCYFKLDYVGRLWERRRIRLGDGGLF
jgi:hypothetical protein